MIKNNNIKISKSIVNLLYRQREIIFIKNYNAIVGILSSNSNIINNVYFIPRSSGCCWFPKMEIRDISSALCKVIKDKQKVKGLIVLHTLSKGLSSGEGDTEYDHNTICSRFRDMITKRGWRSKHFVYIVCGKNKMFGYKLLENETGMYRTDYKLIELKEV